MVLFQSNDCLGFDLSMFNDGSFRCFVHVNATLFAIKFTEGVMGVNQFTRQPCNASTPATTPATTTTTATPTTSTPPLVQFLLYAAQRHFCKNTTLISRCVL